MYAHFFPSSRHGCFTVCVCVCVWWTYANANAVYLFIRMRKRARAFAQIRVFVFACLLASMRAFLSENRVYRRARTRVPVWRVELMHAILVCGGLIKMHKHPIRTRGSKRTASTCSMRACKRVCPCVCMKNRYVQCMDVWRRGRARAVDVESKFRSNINTIFPTIWHLWTVSLDGALRAFVSFQRCWRYTHTFLETPVTVFFPLLFHVCVRFVPLSSLLHSHLDLACVPTIQSIQ